MKVTELNPQQYAPWSYPSVRLFHVETKSCLVAGFKPETLIKINRGDRHPGMDRFFAQEIWQLCVVNPHNVIVAVGYSPVALIFNLPKTVPLPPSVKAALQGEWRENYGPAKSKPWWDPSPAFGREYLNAIEARAMDGLPPKENNVNEKDPAITARLRLQAISVDDHTVQFILEPDAMRFFVDSGHTVDLFSYEVARRLHAMLDPHFCDPRRTPSATEPDQEKTVKTRHGMRGFVSGDEIPAWRRWMRTTFNAACILLATGAFGALGYFTEWYVGVAPPVLAGVVVGAVRLIRHWTGFYVKYLRCPNCDKMAHFRFPKGQRLTGRTAKCDICRMECRTVNRSILEIADGSDQDERGGS